MRNWIAVSLLATWLPSAMATSVDAADCGSAPTARCAQPKSCQCVPDRVCQEVVYEEYERTAYKTVFEEVMEKKEVCTIKYVEETEDRPACCTVYEPCMPDGCNPCAPQQNCGMRQEQCIRKVPHAVYRPVCEKTTIEVPRIVEKRIPYTVTCLKPRIVSKEMPAAGCCPKCCCPAACGE